jgi:hypothetical protein
MLALGRLEGKRLKRRPPETTDGAPSPRDATPRHHRDLLLIGAKEQQAV